MNISESDTTKKSPVFYGWWIVLSSAIIMLYSGGTWFYGFTVFINPLVDEYGWSYLMVSIAASLRGLEIGLAAPFMGILVDKFGPRKLVFFGGIIAGAAFILMSYVNSLPMFFIALVLVSIGFSSCEVVVLLTAVSNWFYRRVGLALGLASLGFGAAGFILPALGWLVSDFGIRTTFIILGIGCWLVIPPLSLLLRHKPEQYGYLPDGDRAAPAPVDTLYHETSGDSSPAQPVSIRSGLKDVFKSRNFWLLSIAMTIVFMGCQGVIVHIAPYLISVDFDHETAALMAGFIPISSIGGRLAFSWLSDRMNRKTVMSMTIGGLSAGFALLYFTQSMGVVIGFLVLFGSSFGGAMAVRPAFQREYFGRKFFGSIQGLTMLIGTAGGIGGPIFTGWVFNTFADYRLAWIAFAVAVAATIPLFLAIRHTDDEISDHEHP